MYAALANCPPFTYLVRRLTSSYAVQTGSDWDDKSSYSTSASSVSETKAVDRPQLKVSYLAGHVLPQVLWGRGLFGFCQMISNIEPCLRRACFSACAELGGGRPQTRQCALHAKGLCTLGAKIRS